MPRFYFDIVDDKTVYDHEGVSLPDSHEAKKFAIIFARELMETKRELFSESWEAWAVRVSDGQFQPILHIPFTEVLPPEPKDQ